MASNKIRKMVTKLKDVRDKHGNKLSHIAARARLEKKSPGKYGVSEKGVYTHNPKTGFNERVDHRNGKLTGKDAY